MASIIRDAIIGQCGQYGINTILTRSELLAAVPWISYEDFLQYSQDEEEVPDGPGCLRIAECDARGQVAKFVIHYASPMTIARAYVATLSPAQQTAIRTKPKRSLEFTAAFDQWLLDSEYNLPPHCERYIAHGSIFSAVHEPFYRPHYTPTPEIANDPEHTPFHVALARAGLF
jgi:hypothetical protein